VLLSIISSLCGKILTQLVKCLTSLDVWQSLERMFTLQSRAQTMQIHYQLATLKKGNSSIANCFHQFTNLADTLAAIDQPLNDFELVSFLWARLGSDYNSFVTSVTTCVDPLSLEDLYGHLLTHEVHLEQNQPVADLTLAAANFANRGNSSRSGCSGRHTCPAHQPGHGSPSTKQKTS